jgi:hypothetical protein
MSEDGAVSKGSFRQPPDFEACEFRAKPLESRKIFLNQWFV